MTTGATETAPATIALTESDHEFFAKSGPLPTAWDEYRRFPRFYFRSCFRMSIFPPHVSRGSQPADCWILTRDLSRSGMSILHNEQLFPGQQLAVVLNGVKRKMVVLWCRRLGQRCYTAGCRFSSSDDAG